MTTSAPSFTLLEASRLKPHEETDEDNVKRLADRIRRDGEIVDPVLVDRATGVILDGHHRYRALRQLDCSLVPCYRVAYLESTITVETWDESDPVNKREILRRGMDGDLFPAKTTRHRARIELPARATPLSRLRRGTS